MQINQSKNKLDHFLYRVYTAMARDDHLRSHTK